MKVFGPIDLNNNELKQTGFEVLTYFPSPKEGKVVYRSDYGDTYVCVSASPPVWMPTTNAAAYTHHQPGGGMIWDVMHMLGTSEVFVQVYDDNGQQIIPDSINIINQDNVVITFGTSSVAGKAVVSALNDHVGITLDGAVISDITTTTTTTWSSQKIQDTINAAVSGNITPIVGQASYPNVTQDDVFILECKTIVAIYEFDGSGYVQLIPGIDYTVRREFADGSQIHVITKNKQTTADLVVDYM